ncbi:MAG: AI-2E family transporter [Deltaproteobacteria bacterium]|nr:AI-2E family transporter [Deltaproteobacteria bacterium]
MELSLDQFYRLNRRILIWVALFVLIWLLRDFFGLIFLIFVLTFISAPISRFARERLHLPHWLSIVAVYLCFLIALGSFVQFVAPRVIREADTLLGNLEQLEATLVDRKNELVRRYPSLNPIVMGYVRSGIPEKQVAAIEAASKGKESEADDELLIRLYIEHQLDRVRDNAPYFLKQVWKASATMLLALLFAFLISLDIARLKEDVASLRRSRLHDFYDQTAMPVVRFGYVVGRAFRIQALIACINTLFTAAGLLVLGISSLAVLSLIVFVCSFIPVLGVFLSTTPIVLVALNTGGFRLAAAVVVLVIVIHLVEAYVLNPMIYGRHLKLNAALVLMILFIGNHAFGLWGMILGVPVTYYLLHDVFGVPLWEKSHLPAPPNAPE